ncbi:odorant receptor 63a-like isoform X2 [Diachasmimorpha longicaudata]|uniref:odorant receptor 63a-like isoform X2 n=1 Tax=Diachasmimorpha longicaudata TaxID=58733 RepID=UPI0030B884F8
MDFWDQDYFRISKIISSLVGQWPNQSVKELFFSRGILVTLTVIQLIPRTRAVVLHSDDPEVILDAVGPFIIDTVFVIKTLTNWYNFKKMKSMLSQMKENWKIFTDSELEILHQHTAAGKRLSLIYLGSVFSGGAVFATEPLQLRLVHTFIKTNATLPLFPMPVDYGSIDVAKYYWWLFLLAEVTTFLIVFAIISCDLLFFIYSYHVFGLFAALGYAIEHLPVDSNRDSTEGIAHVKRCVQIHYRATEFADALEELYIWNFLAVVGLNMIIISVTGVQIVVNLDATEKVIQYGSLTISQLGHLFVECLLGQRLIDYSLGIQEHVSNARWYYSSVKSQKMLGLLLMRSQWPCQLTAGKFLVMNFQTFNMIIRTSASYFTVLLATQ